MKGSKSKTTNVNKPNPIQEKKKSKSKKNKKDWIKNIDVSNEEKKRIKKLDNQIKGRKLNDAKNEDLFQEDKTPVEVPRGFLKRKTIRPEMKKTEVNKIKRKAKAYENRKLSREEEKIAPKENTFDLWEDTENANKLSAKPIIQFPKVPIAHPGQSYNPSKKDLKSLITNIVEVNTKLNTSKKEDVKADENTDIKPPLANLHDDESENTSEVKEDITEKVPAKNRTRASKSKELQKKLNKMKNQRDLLKKRNKVEIDRLISGKRFEKIQLNNKLQLEKEERKKKFQQEEESRLTQIGITKE